MCQFSLNGNTYVAAKIRYDYISNQKYKLSLIAIMDCRYYSLNQNYEVIKIHSVNKSISVNKTIKHRKTTNLAKSSCSINCAIPYSFKEYTFEDTIDFSHNSLIAFNNNSACDIYFTLISASRQNTSIISGNSLNISSFLDKCNSAENSSPEVKSFAQLLAPCNMPYYNREIINDINNNQLEYELQPVLNSGNTKATYNNNLDYKYPLYVFCPPNLGVSNCKPLPNASPPRGFYFNTSKPEIIFTPNDCDQSSIISYRINEYKNDSNGIKQLSGFMDYQFSIFVLDENNFAPIITAPKTIQFCTNNNNDYEINITDELNSPLQTKLDGIGYKINFLPKGAKITTVDSSINNVKLRLSFHPADSQVTTQLHSIEIIAYDLNCTHKLINIHRIEYKINSHSVIAHKIKKLSCSKIGRAPLFNNASANWKIQKENVLYYHGRSFIDTSISLPKGKYQIFSTYNTYNGCIFTLHDSIELDSSSIPKVYLGRDSVVCPNDTFIINSTIINGKAPYRYKWNNYSLNNMSAFYTTGSSSPIYIRVFDDNQCVFTDTINIRKNREIKVYHNYNSVPTCKGDSSNISIYSNSSSFEKYQWSTPTMSGASNSPTSIKIPFYENTPITIRAIDKSSPCFDEVQLNYLVLPTPNFTKLISHENCQGDSLILNADLSSNSIKKTEWKYNNKYYSTPNLKIQNLVKNVNVFLTYTDTSNCQFYDTSKITIYPKINKSIPEINSCNGEVLNLFNNGFEPLIQGYWNYSSPKIDSLGNIQLNKNEIIDIEYRSQYKQCNSLQKARIFVNKDSVYATLKANVTLNSNGIYTKFTFPEYFKNGSKTQFEVHYGNGSYIRLNKTTSPVYYTYPFGSEYYPFMVSKSQKCTDTFYIQQPITMDYVKGNELAINDFVKIYPNPTPNALFIELAFNSEYKITDALGKEIESGKLNPGLNSIELENKGIYFIHLISDKGNFVYKVIKN